MSTTPRVSVVIPTVGRPTLLRAVDSACRQTVADIEIIVCDNGHETLPSFTSDRVRVIRLDAGVGGNAARQSGIEAASAPVIALLDDDDHWHPNHLEVLLASASAAGKPDWIASSTGSLETGASFPSRDAHPDESALDYCFRARSPRRKGAMPTSGLLFPTKLARRVPWRSEVRFHQDLTWIIEVSSSTDCQLITSRTVTFSFGDTANSVSKSIRLEESIRWACEVLLPVAGRRLFADFLLTRYPLKAAASQGRPADVTKVLRTAFSLGAPSPAAFLYAGAQVAKSMIRRAR